MPSRKNATFGKDITNVITDIDSKGAECPDSAEERSHGTEAVSTNPQECHEYAIDITEKMFQQEALMLPEHHHWTEHAHLTQQMRALVLEWMVKVCRKWKLRPETMHLSVNLTDRYSTKVRVEKRKFQLVGVVAIFIASKNEEIKPPKIKDLVRMTDNAYTEKDVLDMEVSMLTALNFQIIVPTAAHFAPFLQEANECDATHCELVQHIIELALLDIRVLPYVPSHLVSAALLLSNRLLEREPAWPEHMVSQSRHDENELLPCLDFLKEVFDADQVSVAQLGEPETVSTNAQDYSHEYVIDIQEKLFHDEALRLPIPDYLGEQTDLNGRMRAILIDWLVDVHRKWKLRSETLYLSVNLIDRYLMRVQVCRQRLQLVGIVALQIASKFEDIDSPELKKLVWVTGETFTEDDVLSMEVSILNALNFQVLVPTAAHFAPFLQKANGCNDTHCELVQYIIELGLVDVRVLLYTPSHLVSAAVVLSNRLLQREHAWPENMVSQSHYEESELLPCAEFLKEVLEADQAGGAGQLRAVYKKFSPKLRTLNGTYFPFTSLTSVMVGH